MIEGMTMKKGDNVSTSMNGNIQGLSRQFPMVKVKLLSRKKRVG